MHFSFKKFQLLFSRFTVPGLMATWSKPVHVHKLPWTLGETKRGELLDILVSQSCCLTKEFEIPAGAAKNLSKAVDLFVRTSLPGQVDDIVWTFGTRRGVAKSILVKIWILKQSSLKSLVETAQRNATRVRTVRVANEPRALPFVDYSNTTDQPLRMWRMVHNGLATAVVATLVWFASNATSKLELQTKGLQSEISALRDEAVAIKSIAEERSKSRLSYEQDVATLQLESTRLELLLALSNTLSDRTWLSELNVYEDQVVFSGFTDENVSDVLSRVRKMENITTVELYGNVVFDTVSRRHRFEMTATLGRERSPEL